MKITAKLLMDLNRRGSKEAASFRIHEDIYYYMRQRAYDLGITQARYVEGLVLAEAASKSPKGYDLSLEKIREYLC